MLIPACLVLGLALFPTGCTVDPARDSRVFQGKCVSLSPDGKTMVLANEQPKLNPIKTPMATFELAQAKVGLPPEKGNIIRVAYLQKGERMLALKVMNVSKQDLKRK